MSRRKQIIDAMDVAITGMGYFNFVGSAAISEKGVTDTQLPAIFIKQSETEYDERNANGVRSDNKIELLIMVADKTTSGFNAFGVISDVEEAVITTLFNDKTLNNLVVGQGIELSKSISSNVYTDHHKGKSISTILTIEYSAVSSYNT